VRTVFHDIVEIDLRDHGWAILRNECDLVFEDLAETMVRLDDLVRMLGLDQGLLECYKPLVEERGPVVELV